MARITRSRRLTEEEAAHYNDLREKIEREKPEITARVRSQLAQRRKEQARRSGRQTLGERIRAAREARGYTQVNLAAAAGISQGYLSQIERDEREPTLSIAARLAGALGVSLDELAGDAA
jgi:ribosome-binding protein aMBF1 (putative translation factor)